MATFTIETDVQPPLVVVSLADWNALNETVVAAERRVAELEARLADEWRPVTTPPIEDGWYDVYAPDFKDYGEFQDTARWERSEWFVYGEPISPTHWAKLRPAPTPPPTATE